MRPIINCDWNLLRKPFRGDIFWGRYLSGRSKKMISIVFCSKKSRKKSMRRMGKKGWDSLKWSSSIKKKFNKKNLLGRPKRMWLKLIEIWSTIYSRWPCRNPPNRKNTFGNSTDSNKWTMSETVNSKNLIISFCFYFVVLPCVRVYDGKEKLIMLKEFCLLNARH